MHGAQGRLLRSGGSVDRAGQGSRRDHHGQSRPRIHGIGSRGEAEDHGRRCVFSGRFRRVQTRRRAGSLRGPVARYLQKAGASRWKAGRRHPGRRRFRRPPLHGLAPFAEGSHSGAAASSCSSTGSRQRLRRRANGGKRDGLRMHGHYQRRHHPRDPRMA